MTADAATANAASRSLAQALNVWLVEDNETYRGAIARTLDHAPGLRCAGCATTIPPKSSSWTSACRV
jgi:hypothetical protein